MKFSRKASAVWEGSGKEGKGSLTTASTVLNNTQYSFKSRFEDGIGTNPEELIGAALSGCFSMKLSFLLGDAGYTPTHIHTEAKVDFEDGSINHINLNLSGKVNGIDAAEFEQIAKEAKATCPISGLLKAEISLDVHLEG